MTGLHSVEDFDPDDLEDGELPAGFHVVDPEDDFIDDDLRVILVMDTRVEGVDVEET